MHESESGLLRAALLSPDAKPRGFQLYTRHKRPFLLEVHILFCPAAERKRVFAFENIQREFEVTDVLLVAICYLSFLFVVPRTFSIIPALQAWNRMVSFRCLTKIFKYIEFYYPDIKLQCLDMEFQCFVQRFSLPRTLNKETLKNRVLRSNKRCADSD